MYVFYACSNGYVPYLGVSIASLFENNSNINNLEVFICNDSISEENLEKLKQLAESFSRKITFLDYSLLESTARRLNWRSQGGSFCTYSKLLVEQYMPSYVDRVLYIDASDTYVAGSLAPLEDLKMKDCAYAARVAMGYHMIGNSIPTYDHAIARQKTYYNCGVLLIDMENWRKRNCFQLIEKKSIEEPHFDFFDQTIINAYLPSDYGMRLPLEYNYNGYVYSKAMEKKKLSIGGFYTDEEIEYASKHPVIIHWPGRLHRPYIKGALCRKKEIYLKCFNRLPWKDSVEFVSITRYLRKSKGFAYKYFPLIEFYLPRTSIILYKIVCLMKKSMRR